MTKSDYKIQKIKVCTHHQNIYIMKLFIKKSEKNYELTDLPKYGDLYPIDVFSEMCEDGCIIDSDGRGYYATESKKSNILVDPDEFWTAEHKPEFTHVIWFNK